MNVFILEGKNDAIFLMQLLNKHFKFEDSPVFIDKGNYRKGINNLRCILLNKSKYNFYKTNYGFIIYGDNGKQNVVQKVLPRLVQDTFGKISEELKFLIILDQNGESKKDIMTKIRNNVIKKLVNIPYANLEESEDNILYIYSEKDPQYRIIVQLLFLVPMSLEAQLRKKCLEKLKKEVSRCQKDKLLQKEPHEALDELAQLMGINMDELIRKSVIEGWFNNETWYITLLEKISQICNFTKISN